MSADRPVWVDDPRSYWAAIDAAVRAARLPSPVLAVDAIALEHNIADLARRAGGVPIRVASKSLRIRSVISDILRRDGFAGVLAYTVDEAHWLATAADLPDVLLGYPSADVDAIERLVADDTARSRVTLLVDSVEHLDLIDRAVPPSAREPVRVAIDLDASLRYAGGLVHLGVRRSPVHSVSDARDLARKITGRRGFSLVGVMSYEAQVAGLANDTEGSALRNKAIGVIQARSMRELLDRRGKAIRAIGEYAELEFVNAGGTGSLEVTAADRSVTDIAAGSGFFGGHLFDGYAHFQPAPAMGFGLDVVRRPARDIVTVLGGGWIASGPPAADRLPKPVWPQGLSYIGSEAAGEVQTPLRGDAAKRLQVGGRVWFRHTKSGEPAEHANEVAIIDRGADGGPQVIDVVPTYRGEGKCFL
ncbi:alanine racemase [Gordonia sp. X0973]|uniref:alanine racemase n=1 Tax=Gordonia sp. X0973 TaxID=2742602 RepID=UPI000F51BA3A|nr:alanine racemase [Gordonia sp. X0973]QKT06155.1 alanine racemase [Gordonia sp. X0973]